MTSVLKYAPKLQLAITIIEILIFYRTDDDPVRYFILLHFLTFFKKLICLLQ